MTVLPPHRASMGERVWIWLEDISVSVRQDSPAKTARGVSTGSEKGLGGDSLCKGLALCTKAR